MRTLIYVGLHDGQIYSSAAAAPYTFPKFPARQARTFALRFLNQVNGQIVEQELYIRSLKASIGFIDKPPFSGKYKIKVGTDPQSADNTTDFLDWNENQSTLEERLNDVTDKPATFRVQTVTGGYLIGLTTGAAVTLSVVSNQLDPLSFGRIEAQQIDGEWWYELRLLQAPLAFTDSSEQVLPEEPNIETLVDGYTDPSGAYFANEVQRFTLPADFRSLFYFTRNSERTELLSVEDGIDRYKEVLDAMLALEDAFVATRLPKTNVVDIEFQGALSGIDIDELGIVIPEESTPPGDWTFTIDLGAWEMIAALRDLSELKDVPFELEAEIVDNAEDLENLEIPGRIVKLFNQPVTIVRPLLWEGLSAAQNIDWTRPPSPKNYLPFTLTQFLTGQQQAYSEVIGDGVATEFVIDHNFASELCQVVVRENTSGGRRLHENEYEVVYDNDNSLTLTFTDPPDSNSLAVFVISIGPVSVFQNHTHTIAQIEELQDILDQFGSAISDLQDILPSTGPGATTTQPSGITIELPETQEALFFAGQTKEAFTDQGLDSSKLGRGKMMFPAVHDSAPTSFAGGDLPSPAAGTVWQNDSGSTIDFGRNIYGGKVPDGGYFASDGRALYAVTRDGSTTSYFPRGFERELWRIFINDKMLRVNRTLDVQFGLALQLVNASSNAQWLLVIEKGTAPSQSTPATTGTNLENVEWDSEPLLSQRLIITQNRQTHSFGVRIKRALVSMVDTISLDTLLYGVWEGNDSAAPAAANFALRARLIKFDTENALESDARGWVTYEIIPPTGSEDNSDKPKAVIT